MLYMNPFGKVMFTPLQWWFVLTLSVTTFCTTSVMIHSHLFVHKTFAPLGHNTFALLWTRHVCAPLDTVRTLLVTNYSHLSRQDMFVHLRWWPIHTSLVTTLFTFSVTTYLHSLSDNFFALLWWWSVRIWYVAPLRWQHVCTSSVTIHSHLFGYDMYLFGYDRFAHVQGIIRLLIFSKTINNFIE